MNAMVSRNARKAFAVVALASFALVGCDSGENKVPDQTMKDQAAEIARKDAEAYAAAQKEIESNDASAYEGE